MLSPQQQRWRQALHSPKDCRSQSRLDLRRAFRGQRVGNCDQIREIPECGAVFPRRSKSVEQGTATQTALGPRVPLVSLVQAFSVAEHLNFRHAACALGASQSSVSTRIKQLEQDLGVLLFERRHRGVRLTEAGQHFLEHVDTGIEHLDHAVRTAGAIARGEQGELRVGLFLADRSGLSCRALGQFRELHPTIDLQIAEGRARTPFGRFARRV